MFLGCPATIREGREYIWQLRSAGRREEVSVYPCIKYSWWPRLLGCYSRRYGEKRLPCREILWFLSFLALGGKEKQGRGIHLDTLLLCSPTSALPVQVPPELERFRCLPLFYKISLQISGRDRVLQLFRRTRSTKRQHSPPAKPLRQNKEVQHRTWMQRGKQQPNSRVRYFV